jgi:Glycogen recognition site of AMP-activated protein kinase
MEMRRLLLYSLLMTLAVNTSFSQGDMQKASYTIREGRMYIRIMKKIGKGTLDKFVDRYDLGDLDLGSVLASGQVTQLTRIGWRIDINNEGQLVISKPIGGIDQLGNPEKRMALTEDHPNSDDLFPPRNDDLVYGFNRFTGKFPFAIRDSLVTFFVKGHSNAHEVLLAASFTSWQFGAYHMTRTDSGWISVVRLGPGKYWYKFIIDGGWTTDPDNALAEADPNGNVNSVYYKPNVVFSLDGHTGNKDAFITGSFNGWKPGELPMQRTPTGWTIQLYLADGTYTYKFVVDGKRIEDPANSNRAPDEHNGFNSVFRLGSPHLFALKGYKTAKTVVLAGTFNNWQTNEWYMHKTADGWELPFTLGPGNYQYRFIVDGKWIDDPANPLFVYNRPHHVANAYLIIGSNYTFRLRGYPDANEVCLAGDFNDWTPNALKMKRIGDAWIFKVHLSVGKHVYKFVVDGHWIKDPDNPLWEENEYNTDNSVLWWEEK